MAMIEAAQRNDVFLMEAFMYRCHPQIAKLVELLRADAIGQGADDPGDVRASAPGSAPRGGCSRTRWRRRHPGRRLLRHSMARLVAGVAMGKDFAERPRCTV